MLIKCSFELETGPLRSRRERHPRKPLAQILHNRLDRRLGLDALALVLVPDYDGPLERSKHVAYFVLHRFGERRPFRLDCSLGHVSHGGLQVGVSFIRSIGAGFLASGPGVFAGVVALGVVRGLFLLPVVFVGFAGTLSFRWHCGGIEITNHLLIYLIDKQIDPL